MKDKIWEVDYQGYSIRVANKFSLFPPATSENLNINNVAIKHNQSSLFSTSSTLIATYRFHGIEKKVEARLAQKTGSVTTGAQIYINNEYIGGDKSICYPDPERAVKQYQKGYFQYFLTVGLLNLGLPFSAAMALFRQDNPIALRYAVMAVIFGGAMSALYWNGIKSVAQLHKKVAD